MSLLTNLVAAFKLDGDETDATGNGHDGTVVNGPITYVAGVNGQAATGINTGSPPRIELTPLSLGTIWTFAAWVKPTTFISGPGSTLAYQSPLSPINGLCIDGTGNVGFYDGGGTTYKGSTPVPLVLNVWSHVVVTYDGTTLRFYIDGSLVSSGAAPLVAWTPGYLLAHPYGLPHIGLLDDVNFYDRALSDPEAAELAAAGAYPFAPSIIVDVVVPNTGPTAGGTAVQIFGDGFTGTSAVEIGGSLCSDLNVINNNTIECLTPPKAAGAYDVVVHNVGTATLANGFTYADPPPSISSVSPTVGPASGGTEVLVSGSAFVDGCTVEFGGELGTITGFQTDELTVLTPARAPALVDVVVTNPDAQLDTAADAFRFYDDQAPVVTRLSPPESVVPAPGDTIKIRVTDETALRKVVILADFGDPPLEETVFNGERFSLKYSASLLTISPGQMDFDLRRTPGWPSRPTLQVLAVDTSGNRAGLPPYSPVDPPDATAPTATQGNPGQIGPTSTLKVIASDDVELGQVVLLANFVALGLEEWVWNGTRFAAAYDRSYVERSLSGGLTILTFWLRRTPGWPASPAIEVVAIDTSGNEGTP